MNSAHVKWFKKSQLNYSMHLAHDLWNNSRLLSIVFRYLAITLLLLYTPQRISLQKLQNKCNSDLPLSIHQYGINLLGTLMLRPRKRTWRTFMKFETSNFNHFNDCRNDWMTSKGKARAFKHIEVDFSFATLCM